MSVLAVLEYFTEPVKISFFCDSQYVLNTIEKG
jgi:ribonuclease HI